jgi:hypothetical protein
MDGVDFSTVLAGLAAATIVTAILAAGAIKAAPNFVKWGVNKLAGFFGG